MFSLGFPTSGLFSVSRHPNYLDKSCIFMCFSTILTVLFCPCIAHERTAHNLNFVSTLVALRSGSHWAPSLPKSWFAQERRAMRPALIHITQKVNTFHVSTHRKSCSLFQFKNTKKREHFPHYKTRKVWRNSSLPLWDRKTRQISIFPFCVSNTRLQKFKNSFFTLNLD